MADSRIRKRIILTCKIISLLAVTSFLLIILFGCGYSETGDRYNFIDNFPDAVVSGFPSNQSEILRYLPAHDYYPLDAYMKKEVTLLGSYVETLPWTGTGPMKNGAVRFRVYADQHRTDIYDVKFRYIDKNNYLGFEMKVAFTSSFFLYEVKGGKKRIIRGFSPDLVLDQYNIIYLLFFDDYIVVCNDDLFYWAIREEHIRTAGRIIPSSIPDQKSDYPYQIKYGGFEEERLDQIIRSTENMISIRNWLPPLNPLYPEDNVKIEGKEYPVIRRFRIGSATRRALLTPIGASIKYNIRISDDSFLTFDAALFSRYHYPGEERETVEYRIRLIDSDEVIAECRYRMPPFSVIQDRWQEVVIDLSKYSCGDYTIELTTTALNDNPRGNNRRQVAVWGEPAIFRRRETDQPNILLISLDTLRSDHLSCYGYSRNTSPYIDSFAGRSIRFQNCISAATHTLPSHRSIFTGLFATETGYNFYRHREGLVSLNRIDERILTIADHLRGSGYNTVAFTGGGYVSSNFGFDKGFDEYNEPIEFEQDAAADVQKAINWINKNHDRKFFMFFHTYEIHAPYKRTYFLDSIDNGDNPSRVIAAYDSGIRYADFQLERLMQALKQKGIYGNTVIIITSDHGERFDLTEAELKTHPNCGIHGRTVYDCEVKVPLIIGGWKKLQHGKVVKEQISGVDILPTILDMIGLDPDEEDISGRSLLPLIYNGDELNITRAFSEAYDPYTGDGKLSRSTRSEDVKFIKVDLPDLKNKTTQTVYELYDLKKDPQEKKNLAGLRAKLLEQNKVIWERYYRTIMKKFRIYNRDNLMTSSDEKLLKQIGKLGYIN